MKIYILPEVHAQIMHYVHKSNIEISGLGRIEKDSGGNMVVTKCYLLKQENTATSTDICEQAMSDLLYETREDKGHLNFWWHSHVNMNAFWSGTDIDTIKQFGKKGYLVATVFNKKGEYQTAYFQGANEFLPEIFVDKIPTEFKYIPQASQIEAWNKEYDEKCETKVWTPDNRWNHTKYSSAHGLGMDIDDDDDWYWRRTGRSGSTSAPATPKEPTKYDDLKVWNGGRLIYPWMQTSGLNEEQMKILKLLEAEAIADAQTDMNFEKKNLQPINNDGAEDVADEDDELEYVGLNTGKTVDQILDVLKDLFYQEKVPALDKLTNDQYLTVYDAYNFVLGAAGEDGTDFDEKKLKTFYEQTMLTHSNLMEVEWVLREAQYEKQEGEAS